MKSKSLCLSLFVILTLFIAACGASSPETEVATAVPEPTAIPTAEPTAVPPTPVPTNTPQPPEKPEVVASFDAERGELPEEIAIDNEGNIYVSLGPPGFVGGGLGEIWKISPDGTTTTLAQFENDMPAAGLAVDASGNVYYAYPSGDEATGVYRLTPDGDSELLPGTEATIVANGLAFDEDGNLYIGDSILGIWRIPPGGSAELWLQHDLVLGCEPDDPFGANGVAVWEDKLYVANTGQGILTSIPILDDGSAGEPELVAGEGDCDAEVKELYGMDGITIDEEGNVYAMLVLQNKVVKIDPTDGSYTTLLTDEDGLHNPASVVFGVGEGDETSLFFTNYAVLPPVPDASPGPAVLKLDVGVAGMPAFMPENVEIGTAERPEVVASFNAENLEMPEGIAIDNDGNIYVSLGPPLFAGGGFGEIWKIAPDGTRTTLVQFNDGAGPPAAGLAVDASGNLYYGYPSFEEETQGVYRLTPDGESKRLPGTESMIVPNGLAFDNDGNLYVGDSIPGLIWRIPPNGAAEIWLQHEYVAGCGEDGPGANGVVVWEGDLYAANTSRGVLSRTPIQADGSAGEPELVAGSNECDPERDELDAMDGIAIDMEGDIYVLLVMQETIVKIDGNDGSYTTLLTAADGLHNPASVVFGIGEGDETSLFFTNYAVLPPVPEATLGPGVVKFDVGVPGMLAIMPKLTLPQVQVRICVAFEDGKKATGFRLYVRDFDDNLIIPDPATHSAPYGGLIVQSSSGCHSIELPPETYYATAQTQKEVLYVGTSPHFEARVGDPIDIEIVLEGK